VPKASDKYFANSRASPGVVSIRSTVDMRPTSLTNVITGRDKYSMPLLASF